MQSQTLIKLNPAPRRIDDSVRRGSYFVQTWGCQMNEEDSEQITLYLEQIGYEVSADMKSADVILLNTCSVRKKPEDKAFSMLGELGLLKQARPDLIIGVCGCMAQLRADEIRRRAPHVDFVVGTAQIAQIPALVEEAADSKKFRKRVALPERKGAIVTDIPIRHVGRDSKLKCHVPIQYGCDKFCTFCIVPTTRGRERSRPTEEIFEEVAKLVSLGTKEVTLLGQTVNSYGKNLEEGRIEFSELLWKLSEIKGLRRIRYTSPYPRDFRTDLIETIRDCEPVMEHVHMPLQSGDNDILKAMKRLYTRESFLEIIKELREKMPFVGITTDIIVGFPGETDAQFEATVDMFETVRFDGAYMFAYSPRPDTKAAVEENQVPELVKKTRLNHLIDIQNRITEEKNNELIGNTFEVLCEGSSSKNPGMLSGYSREFRMVHFEGKPEMKGEVVNVKAEAGFRWGILGKIV